MKYSINIDFLVSQRCVHTYKDKIIYESDNWLNITTVYILDLKLLIFKICRSRYSDISSILNYAKYQIRDDKLANQFNWFATQEEMSKMGMST